MNSRYSLAASLCLATVAASACGRESKKTPAPTDGQARVDESAMGADQQGKDSGEQAALANVMCYGINTCKGHNACAVTAEDIAATQKDFGDKFAKSSIHVCATLGGCNASSGELNWETRDRADCFAGGGFLIESVDGAKVVVRS